MEDSQVKQMEEQIRNYHNALNEILSLWVSLKGADYNSVYKGIKALEQRPDLPMTMALKSI